MKTNTLWKVLFLLCLGGLAVSMGIIGKDYINQQKARQAYEELAMEAAAQEAVSTETAAPEPTQAAVQEKASPTPAAVETEPEDAPEAEKDPLEGITIPEKNLDWEALHTVNPDIYAWIYIPGTMIDYPILRNEEEPSFYLDHNLDGSAGYPGCIYTKPVNAADWTDKNTVIYGHNMADGTMFQNLHYFENPGFFDENPYVFIYTEQTVLVYEIFAAYPFPALDLSVCFDYSTPESWALYLSNIYNTRDMTANFRESTTVEEDDRIITLSTCTNQEDVRYLVAAVLLNDGELDVGEERSEKQSL